MHDYVLSYIQSSIKCYQTSRTQIEGERINVAQFLVVVISRTSHQDRVRTWAEICRSQSDSEGFSPGTPVFLPLQIRLSRQDLSRRAIKY